MMEGFLRIDFVFVFVVEYKNLNRMLCPTGSLCVSGDVRLDDVLGFFLAFLLALLFPIFSEDTDHVTRTVSALQGTS